MCRLRESSEHVALATGERVSNEDSAEAVLNRLRRESIAGQSADANGVPAPVARAYREPRQRISSASRSSAHVRRVRASLSTGELSQWSLLFDVAADSLLASVSEEQLRSLFGRYILLAAVPQVGKTGAICFMLKWLMHGEDEGESEGQAHSDHEVNASASQQHQRGATEPMKIRHASASTTRAPDTPAHTSRISASVHPLLPPGPTTDDRAVSLPSPSPSALHSEMLHGQQPAQLPTAPSLFPQAHGPHSDGPTPMDVD